VTTQTTKFDILIAGRSTSVRLPNAILAAFKAKADSLKLAYGKAAQAAQREHNGMLAEAIIKWVGDVPLHTTRESYIGAAVELMRPVFEARGQKLPANIRATIAFTGKGWKGKARGQCWSDAMAADGATEIMVCLRETDTKRIINILTHELCHAVQFLNAKEDGKPIAKGAGHGNTFRVVALAMDLEPTKKPTAKNPDRVVWDYALGGEAWATWAQPIIDALGVCPHAALAEAYAKKEAEAKQTTRMLKFTHEGCGATEDAGDYVWRASAKSVADKAKVWCPCCGSQVENPHFEGEVDDEDHELEDEGSKVDDRATTKQARKLLDDAGELERLRLARDKAMAEDDFVKARRLRDQMRDLRVRSR
jgi:hypothetical protein